jgi:hypothetical protein
MEYQQLNYHLETELRPRAQAGNWRCRNDAHLRLDLLIA